MKYNDDFAAQYGSPKQLERLSNSEDWRSRRKVAHHPEFHAKLADDPHHNVRQIVAYHSNDRAIHDKLMHDPHPDVRANIAAKGHKDHLDHLVHDEHWYVRNEVAKHGHMDHMDKLLHDPEANVRSHVANHGTKAHLDHLVHDPDPFVRQAVANGVYADHHRILMHDKNFGVRAMLARQSPYPEVSKHLAEHDPDENLRRDARDNYEYTVKRG